jgi:hypothetical protein
MSSSNPTVEVLGDAESGFTAPELRTPPGIPARALGRLDASEGADALLGQTPLELLRKVCV